MSKEEPVLSEEAATYAAAKAMASSLTPVKKLLNSASSSVFFTPPVSMERKKVSQQQPPPKIPPLPDPPNSIPPLFPTPEATPTPSPPRQLRIHPKLTLDNGEDTISGLYTGGYHLLTKEILDYLEPSDLYNFTLVCRQWSQLTASLPHIHIKLKEYSKQLHKNDENNVDKPFSILAVDRKPLGDARNRLLSMKSGQGGATPSLPTKANASIPKRVMYKHRHCPQCRAVSKQLNLRRAVCTKCNFDFCSFCFKLWHSGDCERQKSPKRPSQEISAGTKRSKKNLKRL